MFKYSIKKYFGIIICGFGRVLESEYVKKLEKRIKII